MRLPLSALAIATLVTASPVRAQTEAWSDAQQVVVRTHVPGPALWRVQKDGSEVIVIGVLPVFPKAQAWNTRRVENALKGARLLITPATSSASAGDMFTLLSAKNLPQHEELKAVVPAPLYTRYAAIAARAGVSIKAFARDRPVWAGARLRRDVLGKLDFSEQEPQATIQRLAHRAGVPVRAAARYKFAPLLRDINAMSPKASEDCLSDALDDIEFDMNRAPKAAAAWAAGDIRTVHANYQGSTLIKCLAGSDQASALLDHSIDDAAAAMTEALKTPGRTVAIFPLSVLLRKDGVLDRLGVQGARISSPDY